MALGLMLKPQFVTGPVIKLYTIFQVRACVRAHACFTRSTTNGNAHVFTALCRFFTHSHTHDTHLGWRHQPVLMSSPSLIASPDFTS